ncbi:DegT/DnrJ/EryC1/StrS family aminotransferase [Alphaproteobacteria bacterium LSUCC0684]
MSKFIPVNEPLLDGNEKKYLAECIDTGWISSEGPFVKRFEEEFAERVGRKHAIAVTNGTAAIDAAIEALGVGNGDEVILPSFTIISCVLQIIRSGARPIFVDSDPVTWNMDVTKVEELITPKTKAIMAVHIYGLPVDMNPLLELCKKYHIKLIEDAAEMIGQTYRNQPCGSFGDISTVSFYPNKHITTGEGGMILTDDDDLADACRSLRNLCFLPGKRFIHEKLGWNLRMTNLQAAVGVAQLEQLDRFIEKKRWIGGLYNDLFSSVKGIQLPLRKTDYAENIYWVYGVLLIDKRFQLDDVIKKLSNAGIGTRPFFGPLHNQPVIKRLGLVSDQVLPVAENLYDRGFYLPSGLGISAEQISIVADVMFKIFSDTGEL